jgi:hypothetical protein
MKIVRWKITVFDHELEFSTGGNDHFLIVRYSTDYFFDDQSQYPLFLPDVKGLRGYERLDDGPGTCRLKFPVPGGQVYDFCSP